jgi:hypothetical protein
MSAEHSHYLTVRFNAIAIKAGIGTGCSTETSTAVTGEPYLEFSCRAPSEAAVFSALDHMFQDYVDAADHHTTRSPMLYWWIKPEISHEADGWRGYMRCLISATTGNKGIDDILEMALENASVGAISTPFGIRQLLEQEGLEIVRKGAKG